MISLSNIWYRDVANLYEAYCSFYDRNPDFGVKYWKEQERIKAEFQTMVYLIEYGLEIVLGEGKYPIYQFSNSVHDSNPKSKSLKETIDFIMSAENPNKYINKDMCTLDENKKELIKKYGRLLSLKIGNPSSKETLEWIARHYYIIHQSVGISKYSVMRVENFYDAKGSFQTLMEKIQPEQRCFEHSSINEEIKETFAEEYYTDTNGFMGPDDNELLPSYEYLEKANRYRLKAMGLEDPFIHYAKEITVYDINWDKEYKQLREEEKEKKKIMKYLIEE